MPNDDDDMYYDIDDDLPEEYPDDDDLPVIEW